MARCRSTPLLPILTLPLLAFLPACVQPLNDRITFGGSHKPPTFQEVAPAETSDPSLNLFGEVTRFRSDWTPTPYIVTFDGVVHGHIFRLHAPIGKASTPREYGRFPTGRDVLADQSSNWANDLGEGVKGLGRSVIGGPFAVFYFIWNGELGEPTVTPIPYKRTPQTGWASGYPAQPSENAGAAAPETNEETRP
ncbi:MAG: hypothetical protein WD114_04275 [Phycisphaerales bacterium]